MFFDLPWVNTEDLTSCLESLMNDLVRRRGFKFVLNSYLFEFISFCLLSKSNSKSFHYFAYN